MKNASKYCIMGGALCRGGLINNTLGKDGGSRGVGSRGSDRNRVHLTRGYAGGAVVGGLVCTIASESVFIHGCAQSNDGGGVNCGLCCSPASTGRG